MKKVIRFQPETIEECDELEVKNCIGCTEREQIKNERGILICHFRGTLMRGMCLTND